MRILSVVFAASLSTFFMTAALADEPAASSSSASNQQQNLTAEQQKDAEGMQILMTIDTNEINAAQEALKKTENPKVKQFAETMIKDHGDNLLAIKQLSSKINITPVSSTQSEALQEKGKSELADLSTLQAKTFDTAYIDAMVKGHESVLKLLNDNLSKDANNQDYKNLLEATRDTVRHHLNMAEEVQKDLNK